MTFASSAALRSSSSTLFIIMVTSSAAADNKNVGIEVKYHLLNSGAVDRRRAGSSKAAHGACSHAGI